MIIPMNARSSSPREEGGFRAVQRDAATLALMDAAERVIAAKGYEGATMQDIALRAGCAAGTTYLYFKSKEDLFHAIVTRHVVALSAQVRQALDADGRALDRLEQGIAVIVAYFNDHRDFFRIFYTAIPGGRAHVPSNLRGAALTAFQESRRRQIEVVREAQRDGSVRKDLAPEDLVDFIHGVNIVTFARWAIDERAPSPRDQLALLWGLELGGLRGARGPR
jgi:AcrR family transcriptional regulator